MKTRSLFALFGLMSWAQIVFVDTDISTSSYGGLARVAFSHAAASLPPEARVPKSFTNRSPIEIKLTNYDFHNINKLPYQNEIRANFIARKRELAKKIPGAIHSLPRWFQYALSSTRFFIHDEYVTPQEWFARYKQPPSLNDFSASISRFNNGDYNQSPEAATGIVGYQSNSPNILSFVVNARVSNGTLMDTKQLHNFKPIDTNSLISTLLHESAHAFLNICYYTQHEVGSGWAKPDSDLAHLYFLNRDAIEEFLLNFRANYLSDYEAATAKDLKDVSPYILPTFDNSRSLEGTLNEARVDMFAIYAGTKSGIFDSNHPYFKVFPKAMYAVERFYEKSKGLDKYFPEPIDILIIDVPDLPAARQPPQKNHPSKHPKAKKALGR